MKGVWKTRRFLFLPIACVLFVLCLAAGCKNRQDGVQEAGEGVYAIYYKNQSGTKLEPEYYEATGTDAKTLLRELLGRMRLAPDDISLLSAFPENLTVSEYEVESSFANLYFDGTYSDMRPAEEIMLRAAVVKTLCQIPDISYITFMVNRQPLMDSRGTPVGIMQPDSFMEKMNGNLDSMQPVTLILYFTNETGDLLYETERTVIYNSDMSMEKLVINQLIAGPDNSDSYPTLPENLVLLGTSVKDGVCYVNFDSGFITNALDIQEYIPIYSVVNSLSELSGISKVQITVNGASDVKFREAISLSTAFERNLDYVGGMN